MDSTMPAPNRVLGEVRPAVQNKIDTRAEKCMRPVFLAYLMVAETKVALVYSEYGDRHLGVQRRVREVEKASLRLWKQLSPKERDALFGRHEHEASVVSPARQRPLEGFSAASTTYDAEAVAANLYERNPR